MCAAFLKLQLVKLVSLFVIPGIMLSVIFNYKANKCMRQLPVFQNILKVFYKHQAVSRKIVKYFNIPVPGFIY